MPQKAQRVNFIANSAAGVGPLNLQAGTAYTFVAKDAGKLVQFTNAGAINATIPPNSVRAFPTGTVLTWEQDGAGQVTLLAGAGVTLRSAGGKVATAAQYAVASAIKIAINTWLLTGNLA